MDSCLSVMASPSRVGSTTRRRRGCSCSLRLLWSMGLSRSRRCLLYLTPWLEELSGCDYFRDEMERLTKT